MNPKDNQGQKDEEQFKFGDDKPLHLRVEEVYGIIKEMEEYADPPAKAESPVFESMEEEISYLKSNSFLRL